MQSLGVVVVVLPRSPLGCYGSDLISLSWLQGMGWGYTFRFLWDRRLLSCLAIAAVIELVT